MKKGRDKRIKIDADAVRKDEAERVEKHRYKRKEIDEDALLKDQALWNKRHWDNRKERYGVMQCTMCCLYSIFTSQSNKLRPTVKVVV